ncbi:MAG: bestrophin family ion channel [Pirellulaceae bacterium]|nr:bestrophin family ion channel [Pirellulaceae bacterium]
MSKDQKTYPTVEAETSLSYSYWLGTFIIRGSVAPRVLLDVLGFGALAVVIVFAIQVLEKLLGDPFSVPAGPFEAAGAVLGLLLVLRVNTGYSRWWEARILWGGIVNQSRNLAITGLAYGPRNTRWRSRLVRWIAVFPHVCRRSLREQRNFPELERLLSEESREWIRKAEHMPDAVSGEIAMLLYEARGLGMDGFAFQKCEEQRASLIDHLGGCERIQKTPLARSGAIQVRQFIFLLLISLPIGLMQAFEVDASDAASTSFNMTQVWIVPLYVMLLAYPLLSLDRIGMELQNPFSTHRIDFLPLDSICTAIERNVLELLHDIEEQQAAAPHPIDVELPPDAEVPIKSENAIADIS